MIILAVLTGIAPQSWAEMGQRAIATAFEVIEIKNGRRQETERFESPAEAHQDQADASKPKRYSG